jgi:hypothetical protein
MRLRARASEQVREADASTATWQVAVLPSFEVQLSSCSQVALQTPHVHLKFPHSRSVLHEWSQRVWSLGAGSCDAPHAAAKSATASVPAAARCESPAYTVVVSYPLPPVAICAIVELPCVNGRGPHDPCTEVGRHG